MNNITKQSLPLAQAIQAELDALNDQYRQGLISEIEKLGSMIITIDNMCVEHERNKPVIAEQCDYYLAQSKLSVLKYHEKVKSKLNLYL